MGPDSHSYWIIELRHWSPQSHSPLVLSSTTSLLTPYWSLKSYGSFYTCSHTGPEGLNDFPRVWSCWARLSDVPPPAGISQFGVFLRDSSPNTVFTKLPPTYQDSFQDVMSQLTQIFHYSWKGVRQILSWWKYNRNVRYTSNKIN